MRIVFMGTPDFAVPSLNALIEAGYEVVTVVAQPDRPVGRKQTLTPPPTKLAAQAHGIPVLQMEKLRVREGREAIEALQPDLIVTAAFGQILSQRILDIPPLGTVNVHASLLPAYRGPAPINWCLVCGEKVAGVTTMFTERGVDTGPMLLKAQTEILPDENAEELSHRLSLLGAELLIKTIRGIEEKSLVPTPQNEEEASYYPMLSRELGRLDFEKTCVQLHNQVRGLYPWPGTWFEFAGGAIKVFKTRCHLDRSGRPGEVLPANKGEGLIVACKEGALEIVEMQAPGGKRLCAADYLRGKPIADGTMLGENT